MRQGSCGARAPLTHWALHLAPAAPAVPAAAATAACTAYNPCTDSPQGALTQLASSPHPLLRADALEAVHLIHTGATRCTWIRGALIDVCRVGVGRGEREKGKGVASKWEVEVNGYRPWPVNVGSRLVSRDPRTEGMEHDECNCIAVE